MEQRKARVALSIDGALSSVCVSDHALVGFSRGAREAEHRGTQRPMPSFSGKLPSGKQAMKWIKGQWQRPERGQKGHRILEEVRREGRSRSQEMPQDFVEEGAAGEVCQPPATERAPPVVKKPKLTKAEKAALARKKHRAASKSGGKNKGR